MARRSGVSGREGVGGLGMGVSGAAASLRPVVSVTWRSGVSGREGLGEAAPGVGRSGDRCWRAGDSRWVVPRPVASRRRPLPLLWVLADAEPLPDAELLLDPELLLVRFALAPDRRRLLVVRRVVGLRRDDARAGVSSASSAPPDLRSLVATSKGSWASRR